MSLRAKAAIQAAKLATSADKKSRGSHPSTDNAVGRALGKVRSKPAAAGSSSKDDVIFGDGEVDKTGKGGGGVGVGKDFGERGTYWTGPNEYLASVLMRANYMSTRRHEVRVGGDGGEMIGELQRLVHYEGRRPPVRQVLVCLKILTYYPPVEDLVPEFIELIGWDDRRVCRLGHYFLRGVGSLKGELYGAALEALEREVIKKSPARRAAAVKTLVKLFKRGDEKRVMDFVNDTFKCIGGARVKNPNVVENKKLVGVSIPGTTAKDKRGRFQKRRSVVGDAKVETEEPAVSSGGIDDGAGGLIVGARGNAPFVKSRNGKLIVSHSTFAALRRMNRVSADKVRVQAFYFDSGLKSTSPSSVRHTMALLEIRSRLSPKAVSSYLLQRLPHRNPPANRKLSLEDLGAKVYFARLLGSMAEDPVLANHIPKAAPKVSKRPPESVAEALGNFKEKATKVFRFLFNKQRVTDVSNTVRRVTPGLKEEYRRSDDPVGVEFAEALVWLLRNPSNRVLIESLRGLTLRRWTTWFEAPIPQAALYNSPELEDPENEEVSSDDDEKSEGDDSDEASEPDDDLGTFDADGEKSSNGAAQGAKGTSDAQLGEDDLEERQKGFFEKLKENRAARRRERVETQTPFYLRKIGEGMVPALEVILRRIYAAMLHDDAVRRFAAADAAIALARANMYGHTAEEHRTLKLAQKAFREKKAREASRGIFGGVNSKAVVVAGEVASQSSINDVGAHQHPLEALVRILRELMREDSNRYVRSRAAAALVFVVGAGGGRGAAEDMKLEEHIAFDDMYAEPSLAEDGRADPKIDDGSEQTSVLMRYFKNYVTRSGAGSGVEFRMTTELIDYLTSEVLDVAPELGESAVELVEAWAMTHPTVGVTGRLEAVWEKVLSMGGCKIVGESIFRAIQVEPKKERLAAAAAMFLRRRALDLAVITVGSNHLAGQAVPEPLPRAIGVEMERYFSALWHACLLGPSAECRTFAVEALGGAATLAGDPFRICTYERLVELIEMRGLGLKIPAERVLLSLDAMYYARERFGEARVANRIPRNSYPTSKEWLEIVWKLAAEASSAAQILLGMPPPPGWEPLGPEGLTDVVNAESMFGNVRDRSNLKKLKDASVALTPAPALEELPILKIEPAAVEPTELNGADHRDYRGNGYEAPTSYAPKGFDRMTADVEVDDYPDSYGNGRRTSYDSYNDDFDGDDYVAGNDYAYNEKRHSRSPSPGPSSRQAGPSNAPIKSQEDADFELAKRLQETELSHSRTRKNSAVGFAPAGKFFGNLKEGFIAGKKKFKDQQLRKGLPSSRAPRGADTVSMDEFGGSRRNDEGWA